LQPGEDRTWSNVDGVVEGFEYREILAERRRPWTEVEARHPNHAAIQARRAAARARAELPEPRALDPKAPDRGSIWYCDFLWNKTYVTVGGDVVPCCVNAVPSVGNLRERPFEQIWNGPELRAMRQRMVMKQPVPVCRGCMHIREIRDPVLADNYLQGRRVASAGELDELPLVLDPSHQRRHRSAPPPVLEWPAVSAARGYVVQFSLDRFVSILFSTDGPLGGPAIRESRYELPKWAWRYAPIEREVFYRVLATLPDGQREVASGSLPAEVPV
jgi:radical SAM protein with 4Fe4S-binding SPASM domain